MPDSESPEKRPLVLVADDSAAFRLMARDTLEGLGFAVAEAENGAEALEAFERRRPALVLMDVHMPDRDGFEICEEIRRVAPNLPVAMVTAQDHVDAIRRAYEVGATDFLTKPINWLLLSHRVRYMLRMHGVLEDFERSKERLAHAQRIAQLGSFNLDLRSGAIDTSQELRRLYGLSRGGEARAEQLLERVPAEDQELIREAVKRGVSEVAPFQLEHRVHPEPGDERIVHTQGEMVLDEDGRPVEIVGTCQDITDRKRDQAQIHMLAYHDGLTRLANRRLFRERLKQGLAQNARTRGCLAVLAIDLDHFKRINDTFGHSVGDLVLQQVAARLNHCVRDSDCVSRARRNDETATTVSRLGGDEFMLLLSDVLDAQDAAKVAQRVLQVLARPFSIHDHELVIGGSIGISIAPSDGDDVETLLRNADAAMYSSKGAGRNTYKFYERSMNEEASRRLRLEGELRKSLEARELSVSYQPKIEIASGLVRGFEALVRWEHPTLGRVSPVEFIPVAEQSGLILMLGEFVLDTACRQAKLWYDEGFRNTRMSVNISPHQFRGEELVPTVTRVLSSTGLSPRCLDLEITESALMENEANAIGMLEQLKRMGITVSLDDFGTGYSSLSYLRRFPVDTVKIDRAFVNEIGTSEDGAALTATIISMGQCLHLKVVAEGVETEDQLQFLREHGCDEMQGYLVSPPVDAEPATEILRRRKVWD